MVWKNLHPLPFASLFGKFVACSWEVVVLCHPFDRSLLSLVFPPLACLPWGRIGWSSWSGDSKAWLKEVSIVSLFSVMLMGTPGIGRAGFLWFLVIGSVLFLVSCYFYCFFRWAFIHFLKRHPLILLCKFTTSGDCQGHTQGACLHIFFIVFGCSGSCFKNNQISLKIIWAISCLFSPSPCWCYSHVKFK